MARKFPKYCFGIALAILFLWLSLRYLLPVALPFLFGLGIAAAAEPAVQLLHQKCRIPRQLACGFSVSFVFVMTTALLVLALGLLMRQAARLQHILPQLEAAATQGLGLLRQWLCRWTQCLPPGFQALITRFGSTSISGSTLAQQALQALPRLLARLVENLSSGLFGIITGIISGYMISGRLPWIRDKFHRLIPENWRLHYLPALREIRNALGSWLLAQLKLAAVAFFLLTAGFLLLRIPNALLSAGLITLVDAFPVLGVGTVLLPWSLISLLQQNPARCLGLLGLYFVIWLTRSVLEPKLVGKSLGLDPLLTLISIYAGWRLLGIPGMLIAPILTMAAAHIYKSLQRTER